MSECYPIKLLKTQMKKLFPEMSYDNVTEWLGHRPATADSLPVIGLRPNADNVHLGFGHHHIGLSADPKTGRWLSKLVTGEPIEEDLSIYIADRKI
jgi:D-amino-acid dehydrogenase